MADHFSSNIARHAGYTTEELEKLMDNRWLSRVEKLEVEMALRARRPTNFFLQGPASFKGSDGGSLSFGSEASKRPYNLEKVLAAEKEFMDQILAKPIQDYSTVGMAEFLKRQVAVVRKMVPGLIAMDICGVQPMSPHTSMLPIMQKSDFFSKASVDEIIAADKDLQQVKSPLFAMQSVGRSLRDSEPQTIRFLDVEPMQSMHWIKSEPTFKLKKEFFVDHDVEFMYPIENKLIGGGRDYIDLLKANKCCEEPMDGVNKLWDELRAMTAKQEIKFDVITARAPDVSLGSIYGSMASGIEPMRQDFFTGSTTSYYQRTQADAEIAIKLTAPVEDDTPMTFTVAKERHAEAGVRVEYNFENTVNWAKWASCEAEEKVDNAAETLRLLGIGD